MSTPPKKPVSGALAKLWLPLIRLLNIPYQHVRIFLLKHFGHNGDIAVAALILSTISILTIRSTIGHTRSFPVEVEVLCENETNAVLAVEPSEIEVTLRGTRDTLNTFDASKLRLVLQTPDSSTAETLQQEELSLRRAEVLGAEKLRVVGFSADAVTVHYDYTAKWVTTNLVALPVLKGTPLQAEATVSLPENLEVSVFGANTKIKALREKGIRIPTEPIDVENKMQSFSTQVNLLIPADLGITRLNPSSVTAYVEIKIIDAANPEESSEPIRLVDDSATKSDTNSSTNSATKVETDSATTFFGIKLPSSNATSPRKTIFEDASDKSNSQPASASPN